MSYNVIFANSQGYVSGKVYYSQIINISNGYFWNGSNVTENPSYATTAKLVTELLSGGIFAYEIPEGLPSGKYRIYFRDRASASVATSDNIVHEKTFIKYSDGAVRFIKFETTVY